MGETHESNLLTNAPENSDSLDISNQITLSIRTTSARKANVNCENLRVIVFHHRLANCVLMAFSQQNDQEQIILEW